MNEAETLNNPLNLTLQKLKKVSPILYENIKKIENWINNPTLLEGHKANHGGLTKEGVIEQEKRNKITTIQPAKNLLKEEKELTTEEIEIIELYIDRLIREIRHKDLSSLTNQIKNTPN